MDSKRDGNGLLDLILPYLENDFSATIFLIENRDKICEEIKEA